MVQKSMKLHILGSILSVMARLVIWRHQPHIVGVTGSVGKTSTKDAISHVLSSAFSVRKTPKNYNNQIGLPLTIIGADSGAGSFMGWVRVFLIWCRAMISSEYPEVIILEYGVDHPGDMDQLLKMAIPSVAVVTAVTHSHQEFFSDIDQIVQEKAKLVRAVTCYSNVNFPCLALLNGDDKRVKKMHTETKNPVYSYGFSEDLDASVSHVSVFEDLGFYGLTFKVEMEGQSVPMRIPHIVGEHSLYSVLAAIAIGKFFKINLVEIASALLTYETPPGRMRFLPGKKSTLVIDDSYNASSPESVIAALKALRGTPATRRICVLGDMLELGREEGRSHALVGKSVVEMEMDVVITVGDRMAQFSQSLQNNGFSLGENLFLLDTPAEASEVLAGIMQEGDIVLIKGSQGMRMEKVVEVIVSPDVDQVQALCRQESLWKEKPFR